MMEKIKAKDNNLKIARMRLGQTQRDVCKGAGVAESTYVSIEKGNAYPSPRTAKKLCEYLRKPFDELFEIISLE
jgi:DNA-binding XRE family transcriptional regulator